MCLRYWISGKVQGVGYRAFACRNARTMGIAGYARNLDDGRVEILACGETQALACFGETLRQGPAWSRVEHLHSENASCIDERQFVSA